MGLRLFDRIRRDGKYPKALCMSSTLFHDLIWRDKSQSICSRAYWKKDHRVWACILEHLGPVHCEWSYHNHHKNQKESNG